MSGSGRVTNVKWDGPYFHPHTHSDSDVSPELFMDLREPSEQCLALEAISSAKKLFRELSSHPTGSQHNSLRPLSRAVALSEVTHGRIPSALQAGEPPALHAVGEHSVNDTVTSSNKYDLAFLSPYVRLGYECPLFARKFDRSSVTLVAPLVEQFIEALR